jgi:hypothetical protein
VVERLPHEGVGLAVKAGVLLADEADDFGKFQVLHEIQAQWLAQAAAGRNPAARNGVPVMG